MVSEVMAPKPMHTALAALRRFPRTNLNYSAQVGPGPHVVLSVFEETHPKGREQDLMKTEQKQWPVEHSLLPGSGPRYFLLGTQQMLVTTFAKALLFLLCTW
jgi:hypothetical protein